MKRFLLFLFSTLFFTTISAQSGNNAYTFLGLAASSKVAALGGQNVALPEDVADGVFYNPSLITEEDDNALSLDLTSYLADTKRGSAAYCKTIKGNSFSTGMQFISYGSFDGTTEENISTGTFSAQDMALNIDYSRQLFKHWRIGLGLKPIYSHYDTYSSFALAVDLGGSYILPERKINIGIALVNIGHDIVSYDDKTNDLPFNTIISFNKQFEHAPFRVHVTVHDLTKWNLKYQNNITTTTITGSTSKESISNIDMLFRHAIFGIDFIPSKVLYLTASYNHRRAREMEITDSNSLNGFSFGGGINTKKVQIGFAASKFQDGIWGYQFTVSTNLNNFIKKESLSH